MLTVNNNVSISGKYKLIWWQQDESFVNLRTFLTKIGCDGEGLFLNLNLTNLEVEDSLTESVKLTFGVSWDFLNYKEEIRPGQMVEEEIAGSVGYSSVWYRCGNKLVKQARPWSKAGGCGAAHTVTREFTPEGLVTTLTTDNNALKAVVFYKRM